jgi:hypothetical protein
VSNSGESVAEPFQLHKPHERRFVSYALFTLTSCMYLFPFMRVLLHGTDEGTLLCRAVSVANGQIAGRDFFEIIGPGTYYWLALFFRLFGINLLATRLCLFLTSLGTALLLYFLSRRACARYPVLPCIIFFSTSLGALWPEISHHSDSNFLSLLAFACMLLWLESRRPILLAAAGFLAGMTTWFLQPKGILLFGAFCIWILVMRQLKSIPIYPIFIIFSGYISAILVVIFYFWRVGVLKNFLMETFLWPYLHYGAVNAVSYSQGLFRDYWIPWTASASTAHWFTLVAAVLILPFFVIAVLPVLVSILGWVHRAEFFESKILLYWFCGWALWLSEIHRRDIDHLVYGSPILIILLVHLLDNYPSKFGKMFLQILSISAISLAAFNFFLVLTAHSVKTRVGTIAMFHDDPVLAYLDGHIAPGSDLFVYPYAPMYYFLSATNNPTQYSTLVYGVMPASMFQEVMQTLDHRKVPFVVWDTNFRTKIAPSVFPGASAPSSGLLMEPYLESHYRTVWEKDGVRIMKRKSDAHAE